MGNATDAGAVPDRVHLTLSGTAVVDPALVARLGRAAWMARLAYNAAVDVRVPFRQGLEARLAVAEARRAGREAPDLPVPSDRFPPVPKAGELGKELTGILGSHPALRAFPRSILDNAVEEACRARARHVKACVEARAAGRKPPKLRFRSAGDDWSVSTDAFMLLRIGDDLALRKPKSRNVTRTTLRNRARRVAKRVARERDWAVEKRRCGWSGDKVAAGLARRAARQARDREAGAAHDEGLGPRVRKVRRDSPRARSARGA